MASCGDLLITSQFSEKGEIVYLSDSSTATHKYDIRCNIIFVCACAGHSLLTHGSTQNHLASRTTATQVRSTLAFNPVQNRMLPESCKTELYYAHTQSLIHTIYI